MKQFIRDQTSWPQPFPPAEYADRRRRVRDALKEAGLDAILVTTPANITWLTGYDMIWYHLKNLTGILVRADADDTVFYDSVAHTTIVSVTPEIREVVYVDGAAVSGSLEEGIAAITKSVTAKGLAKAKIGLEMWGYAPHVTTMEALAEGLPNLYFYRFNNITWVIMVCARKNSDSPPDYGIHCFTQKNDPSLINILVGT